MNTSDPTCWTANATDADLAGLPPYVISVNEIDPMRDEGLAYFRRLLRAGWRPGPPPKQPAVAGTHATLATQRSIHGVALVARWAGIFRL